MADTKISALTAASAAALANEIPINESNASKKLTVRQLADLIGCYKARLTSDHTLASTTGTEVMQITLPTGKYWFQIDIIAQSSTAGVAPIFGINPNGGGYTAATFRMWLMAGVASTTTAVSIAVDDVGPTVGNILNFTACFPHTTASTTAPNLYLSAGIATTGTNVLFHIYGYIDVTSQTDLELWHSSEAANNTTVAAGTTMTVWKVN